MSTIELNEDRTAPALSVVDRSRSRSKDSARPNASRWTSRTLFSILLVVQVAWLSALGWSIYAVAV